MMNRINEFIPDDDGLILDSESESQSDERYQDLPDDLMLSNPVRVACAQRNRGTEDPYWKILLVDDDERVHVVTKIALNQLKFAPKSLNVISAYSGEEAVMFNGRAPRNSDRAVRCGHGNKGCWFKGG